LQPCDITKETNKYKKKAEDNDVSDKKRNKSQTTIHNKSSSVTKIWIDMNSAFVATMLSSPYNYVRNIQYAVPKDFEGKIPGSSHILKNLITEGLKQKTRWGTITYWQFQLRIGWGTGRVAVGMAMTSLCWELTTQIFQIKSNE